MNLNSNTRLSWCPLGSSDEALSNSVGLHEAKAAQTMSGVTDSVTFNPSVDIRGLVLSAPLHEIPARVVIPTDDPGRLGDRSTVTAGTILRAGVRVNGRDVVFSTVTGVRQSGPPQESNLHDWIEGIRTGRWADSIRRVRDAVERGDTDAADAEKLKLPAALPSGIFQKRSSEGLRHRSGLICADLDRLGDQLLGFRQLIEADPHTLGCFLSPSGTGLKVLLPVDLARSHAEAFQAMRRHFLEQFGLEIDEACKDVCRACFVSYDPDAYLAKDALVLTYPPEPVEFTEPDVVTPSSRATGVKRPGDDYDDRGDFPGLLRKHGWTSLGGGNTRWRRPGKTHGVSATLNEVPGRFHVFSSSAAPLEAGKTYRPWHVFAILAHSGDFKAAAQALAAQGYGEPRTRTTNTGRNVDCGMQIGAATMTTGPMTLWPPSRFLGHQEDPGDYLLGDGFIERGEWTSLVGLGGLGKTRLALWLAVCLITRRDWLGLKPGAKPPRVAFLSSENGIRRWKRDLSKMHTTLSQDEVAAVEEKLRILALTPDAECDLRPTEGGGAARMIATLKAETPDLVIFDPLADMIDGDESKTADMVATLRALGNVHRLGCPKAALLIIHHSRSGADNVAMAGDRFNAGAFGRGSKAFYSKVRCELQLAPGDKDDPRLLVLACGKANNTAPFPPRGVVFDPEAATYSLDPSFDYDTWRNNVNGTRKESPVTIADVVEAVRELAPQVGDETTRKAVHHHLSGTGSTLRTVQERIRKAVQLGHLCEANKRGGIKLGGKPLRQ